MKRMSAASKMKTPPRSIRFHFSEPGRSSATAEVLGIMNHATVAKGATMIVMKRKYHLQEASKKTPARTRAMVLASAPARPNRPSFLACSLGSGYIWTADASLSSSREMA